jgi:hypothetical protein
MIDGDVTGRTTFEMLQQGLVQSSARRGRPIALAPGQLRHGREDRLIFARLSNALRRLADVLLSMGVGC